MLSGDINGGLRCANPPSFRNQQSVGDIKIEYK